MKTMSACLRELLRDCSFKLEINVEHVTAFYNDDIAKEMTFHH